VEVEVVPETPTPEESSAPATPIWSMPDTEKSAATEAPIAAPALEPIPQPAEEPTPTPATHETPVVSPVPVTPEVVAAAIPPVPVVSPPTQTPQAESADDFRANLQAAAERKRRLQGSPAPAPASGGSRIARLPLYIVIIGLLGICLLGVGVTLFFVERSHEEPAVVIDTPTRPSLVNANYTPLTINLNSESLVQKLVGLMGSARSVTITPETPTGQMLAAAELGGELAPTSPGSFTRNLKEVAIGFDSDGEPYLVLRGSSYDSLFGGLLAWERSMSTDLAPLFGLPVLNSYREQPGVNPLATGPVFADEAIAGKSARVLRDEQGEDALVYTFLSNTVVVITTNRNSVLNVAPLIRD